jgi:glutathione S-transferase
VVRPQGEPGRWPTPCERSCSGARSKYLDRRLGKSPFLAAPELSCADILSVYRLTSGLLFGARPIDDLPNVIAYVKRIAARPAYQKAMQIAGPKAVAPKN